MILFHFIASHYTCSWSRCPRPSELLVEPQLQCRSFSGSFQPSSASKWSEFTGISWVFFRFHHHHQQQHQHHQHHHRHHHRQNHHRRIKDCSKLLWLFSSCRRVYLVYLPLFFKFFRIHQAIGIGIHISATDDTLRWKDPHGPLNGWLGYTFPKWWGKIWVQYKPSKL